MTLYILPDGLSLIAIGCLSAFLLFSTPFSGLMYSAPITAPFDGMYSMKQALASVGGEGQAAEETAQEEDLREEASEDASGGEDVDQEAQTETHQEATGEDVDGPPSTSTPSPTSTPTQRDTVANTGGGAISTGDEAGPTIETIPEAQQELQSAIDDAKNSGVSLQDLENQDKIPPGTTQAIDSFLARGRTDPSHSGLCAIRYQQNHLVI